jgi:hypothetical protein
MTRIFTDGAEMRDLLFLDSYTASVKVTDNDPAPAYSAYCYSIQGSYSNALKLVSATSECYLRERIWSDYYSDNVTLAGFRTGSSSLLTITNDSSGHIQAKRGGESGTTLATSTLSLTAEQWYLLEIYIKLDDTVGRAVVYVDGVLAIDYTGDTTAGGTTFDNIYWKPWTYLANAGVLGLDDLALNDTTGGVDDSWCGDGIIIKVTPDGNGTDNDWHGSDGDDVDNFEMVDEYPKDDDTTYVYNEGADSGTQDQYTLSDYDGTGKVITRIYPEARVRKTSATAHTVKLGILASGGADEMSAAKNLYTAYTRIVGDEHTVNPVDSNPWEEADIDALEFIVEVG